ncbi:MAG: phosphopantetheine-binding protein [Alphaproteobacteria bacterium]|nr:phosphopantetheine-binding protein [Alphaproteobacteria bacterium]
MSEKSAFQVEVAELIIEALHLEDVSPEDIDPDEPLFGEGLGLDSIDALELSLEISQRYNYTIRSDDPEIQKIFGSLRTLTEAIEANRGG